MLNTLKQYKSPHTNPPGRLLVVEGIWWILRAFGLAANVHYR